LEDATAAVLQPDFHFATEYEQPLFTGGAVELAAKAHRALAKLAAAGRQYRRQHRLGRSLAQRNLFLPEFRIAVGIGVQGHFREGGHLGSPAELSSDKACRTSGRYTPCTDRTSAPHAARSAGRHRRPA